MAQAIQLISLPAVLTGCTGVVDLSEASAGDLTITPLESVYRWDEVEGSLVVEATLMNQSATVYYARLGDAFGSPEGQTQLFVAAGSDGYMERSVSNDWVSVQRASLVEGVRVVPLRPETTYSLVAFLTGEPVRGEFRLRVEYASDTDGTWAGESVSTTFEIQ